MSENRFLCFSLGSEEYAIPLLRVKEVIAVPDVTQVPFTPNYFLGIMNLRGQVISIMDLRQKFGIKSKEINETSVIICDLDHMSIGVVVDAINSVITPSPEEMAPKPDIQSSKTTDYITGVYRKEKRLVLFLDIAKTLTGEDQEALNRKAKKAA